MVTRLFVSHCEKRSDAAIQIHDTLSERIYYADHIGSNVRVRFVY